MTIRSKLIFGFLGIVLLTIAIAGVGLFSVHKISRNIYDVSENLFPASIEAKELLVSVWMANANFKSMVFSQSKAEAKLANDNISSSIQKIQEISQFLKLKFEGQTDIIERIEKLESGSSTLSGLRGEVYKIVVAGLDLLGQNEEIRQKSLSLVDSTINSIAQQVDNAEFEMLLSKGESEQGMDKAIGAIEFMAKNYNELSQRAFPTIRRLLNIKAAFMEADTKTIRILNADNIDKLTMYDDAFIASMSLISGRMENIKDDGVIEASVINKLNALFDSYKALVVGKGGLRETVVMFLNKPSDSLKQKLAKIDDELNEKENEISPIVSSLIDDFEFELLIGTDEANSSIKEGLEKTGLIKTAFLKLSDETLPLTKYLFTLRGDIAMATATSERIMSSDNMDMLAPLDDEFLAQISSAKAQVESLKDILKGADINKMSGYVNEMEKLISGRGGILESRRLLLGNTKRSEQIVIEVGEYIIQIGQMIASTVDEVSAQATEASEATRRIVGASTGGIGISSIIVIFVGLAIAILLSTFIVRNLRRVTDWIKSLSDDISRRKGDLTVRLSMKSKDELGVLGSSFDHFLDNFAEMTKVIRASAGKVDSSAKNLVSTSQEVNASLQQVGTSIQQISKGATSQVTKVEETSRIIHLLTESLKQIAKNAKEVNKSVVIVAELAGKGRESNQDLVKRMGSIASLVERSANAVQELGKRSEQIGEIIDTINSFADQTNLLSLNAAIEAARAGEAGRGFAVVAEEVRKLAEASSKSANEISHLIKGVQKDVDNVITLINTGKKESEEGKVIAEKVSSLQENIVSATKLAEGMVAEISDLIPKQLEGAEQAAAAVTEVSGVAQENASSTEEVSSSTEEMSASMQELVSSADELASVVSQLQELVGEFKLS